MVMPVPDAQEPSASPPVVEASESLRPLPPGWEAWLEDLAAENLPPLDPEVFTVEAPPADPPPDLANELALLDRQIEAAQEELNSPDGWLRLDELLDTRDQVADDLAVQIAPELPNDLMDARFLQRANIADGQVVGGTVQYIEIYQSANNPPHGRVLDVGHYDSLLKTDEVYKELQSSADNGALTLMVKVIRLGIVKKEITERPMACPTISAHKRLCQLEMRSPLDELRHTAQQIRDAYDVKRLQAVRNVR